ncbi:MAG: AAA family ATPase [Oscillospiraceae bacterium]|nr:AAA family ATPase [Oscillospiraceae bacterium]
MGKVIVVTSGKGGTGKTTSVAAISSCLSALGHKTLCVDCDAGLRNLDIVLGMTEFAVSDFSDVTDGNLTVTEAASEHPRLPGLFFLSAPTFRSPEEIDREDMLRFIADARENYDYCLIDSPAGLGAGFALATTDADVAIIVSTSDLSSIRDAQRAGELLRGMGIGDIRLIINRLSGNARGQLKSTLDDVVDEIGAQLGGIVREDSDVYLSSNSDTPLVLYTDHGAARDLLDVTLRLLGEEIPIK